VWLYLKPSPLNSNSLEGLPPLFSTPQVTVLRSTNSIEGCCEGGWLLNCAHESACGRKNGHVQPTSRSCGCNGGLSSRNTPSDPCYLFFFVDLLCETRCFIPLTEYLPNFNPNGQSYLYNLHDIQYLPNSIFKYHSISTFPQGRDSHKT